MTTTNIGKFVQREVINDIDSTLIACYGVNMTDAGVTREEALDAYVESGSTIGAVEILCVRHAIRSL